MQVVKRGLWFADSQLGVGSAAQNQNAFTQAEDGSLATETSEHSQPCSLQVRVKGTALKNKVLGRYSQTRRLQPILERNLSQE
jgi:hypothetical protein